jgi:hypothetical protein
MKEREEGKNTLKNQLNLQMSQALFLRLQIVHCKLFQFPSLKS